MAGTGPFYVRSVRIAGYNTTTRVVWPKMLRLEKHVDRLSRWTS